MITLFLFACVWLCMAKGMKVSAPLTYAFFAILVITAIFRIDAIYLLPIAAVYTVFAIISAFVPWPETNSNKPRCAKERWLNHPAELFGFRIINAILFFVPLPVLSWFGGAALQTFGPMIKRRQQITRDNLAMIMPEYANDEFIKRVWNNWGRSFVEGLKFSTYIRKTDKYVTFRNKELLKQHPQFILSMPHLGYMGLMALAFVKSGLTVGVTYRHAHNPLTNEILISNYGYGKVHEIHFIPAGNAMPIIRALRNGEALTINPDQRFHGAPYIDFMGVPAKTSTGAAQLARKFNLPILMAHVERTHGAHHALVFDEIIELPNTGDADADDINGMKIINDAMGRIIKKKPDEYLWMHRRWA